MSRICYGFRGEKVFPPFPLHLPSFSLVIVPNVLPALHQLQSDNSVGEYFIPPALYLLPQQYSSIVTKLMKKKIQETSNRKKHFFEIKRE